MGRLHLLTLSALLLCASLPVVLLHAVPEGSGTVVEGECTDPNHAHSHSHGHSHGHAHSATPVGDAHAHHHAEAHDHGHAHAKPAATAAHGHGHSHSHSHGHAHEWSLGQSTWADAAAYAPRFDLHAFGARRVWIMAMGASLLVSCASLVCLAFIPLMGARPSPTIVKFLSGFAVGAMLGDAFIHQLPHAFAAAPAHAHSHAHSVWDSVWTALAQQAVGLSCLAGIGVFFLVEKIILHFGDSGHGHSHGHSHGAAAQARTDVKNAKDAKQSLHTAGWLNLFADAVHNFTDGMAIGAAFGSGGPVSGWAKTMFIMAHELPQEVGDYGILLSAGFSSWQALGFNFLSALVALAGTAFALAVGSGSAVGSGLVEGFTAGGFIYISVAGVIPMMHSHRGDSVLMQMLSMLGGVAVCVAIHANGGCDGHH